MSNNRARKNGNQKKNEDLKDQDINRERFLTVLKDMTGQHVKVLLKDKSSFDAIFHTVNTIGNNNFTYVFKAAKSKKEGNQYSGYTTKLVKSDEVVQITIASIVLKENQPGTGEFATDGEISGNSAAHLMNRDLTMVDSAWLDKDLEADSELAPPAPGEQWDQFQANFKLTGKMATYDESIYTTKLDTSKVDKDKVAAAESLATEIENEAAVGVSALHQATERGQKVDVGGLDEEDLFSGVARTDPKPAEEKPKTKFVFNPDAASFTPSSFKPATVTPPPPPAPPPAVAPAMPYGQQAPYYGGGQSYARGPHNRGGGGSYNTFIPQQQQMYYPPMMPYMAPVVDEYGNPIMDFNGMPMTMGPGGGPMPTGPGKNKGKKKGGKGGGGQGGAPVNTNPPQQATEEVPTFVPES
jgi:hypothetical protein